MSNLSLRAYARRRKSLGLPGGTLRAVQQAIEGERLRRSVVRDTAGKASITDPVMADREWLEHTDATKRTADTTIEEPATGEGAEVPESDADGESFSDARRRKEIAMANLRELEFRKQAGKLIDAAEVRQKVTDTFVRCRVRLLAIPSKAKQEMPHLTVDDVAKLKTLIRGALEDLAEGRA